MGYSTKARNSSRKISALSFQLVSNNTLSKYSREFIAFEFLEIPLLLLLLLLLFPFFFLSSSLFLSRWRTFEPTCDVFEPIVESCSGKQSFPSVVPSALATSALELTAGTPSFPRDINFSGSNLRHFSLPCFSVATVFLFSLPLSLSLSLSLSLCLLALVRRCYF